MSDRALVSVIVIFLNAERFIEQALESIFAQTYQVWELLLVDDGSTDGSTAIARHYAGQFPDRVRYLEHPEHQNRGMSASRNLGIANSGGNFIAFLDADDVWLPQKLEVQMAALQSHPEAAMVYGPTQWWYSWTQKLEDLPRDYIHDLGVPQGIIQPPVLLTRFLRAEGMSPCTCSVLLRSEIVHQVGGFEESFRGLYEDQAFFGKVCLVAPVLASSTCLARYRQHPDSDDEMTQRTVPYLAARHTYLRWLEAYLKSKGISEVDLWQALRSQMWPYRYPVFYKLINGARRGWPGRLLVIARHFRQRWLSLPFIRQVRALQFRTIHPLNQSRQEGTAIVRYFWAQFLRKHQSDIRGKGLEIGTTATIRQYGGRALTCADAIDLEAHSPEVTVVADLSRADAIASDTYDCFVNQFTMHLVYDIEAAIYHSIRLLKPGGALLINFPCVDYYFPRGLDMGTGAPLFLYWWFTPIQVENLFRHLGLGGTDYQLEVYGNLFARIAYQLNMPAEELTAHELNYQDPGHPLLICARVVKPMGWQAVKPAYRYPWQPQVSPARWNPDTGHYGA